MKTPEEIRKKLDEFREKRLEKDKKLKYATEFGGDLDQTSKLFESLLILEGNIEAFKWALEESNTLLNSGIPYKEVPINIDDDEE